MKATFKKAAAAFLGGMFLLVSFSVTAENSDEREARRKQFIDMRIKLANATSDYSDASEEDRIYFESLKAASKKEFIEALSEGDPYARLAVTEHSYMIYSESNKKDVVQRGFFDILRASKFTGREAADAFFEYAVLTPDYSKGYLAELVLDPSVSPAIRAAIVSGFLEGEGDGAYKKDLLNNILARQELITPDFMREFLFVRKGAFSRPEDFCRSVAARFPWDSPDPKVRQVNLMAMVMSLSDLVSVVSGVSSGVRRINAAYDEMKRTEGDAFWLNYYSAESYEERIRNIADSFFAPLLLLERIAFSDNLEDYKKGLSEYRELLFSSSGEGSERVINYYYFRLLTLYAGNYLYPFNGMKPLPARAEAVLPLLIDAAGDVKVQDADFDWSSGKIKFERGSYLKDFLKNLSYLNAISNCAFLIDETSERASEVFKDLIKVLYDFEGKFSNSDNLRAEIVRGFLDRPTPFKVKILADFIDNHSELLNENIVKQFVSKLVYWNDHNYALFLSKIYKKGGKGREYLLSELRKIFELEQIDLSKVFENLLRESSEFSAEGKHDMAKSALFSAKFLYDISSSLGEKYAAGAKDARDRLGIDFDKIDVSEADGMDRLVRRYGGDVSVEDLTKYYNRLGLDLERTEREAVNRGISGERGDRNGVEDDIRRKLERAREDIRRDRMP